MRSSSAASSSGRSTRGQLRGRLGAGIRSTGFWVDVAVLAQRAVEGAQRGELARDGRGDGVAPGEHGGVAAQHPRRRRRRGSTPWRRAPQRELPEVDAVGAARLLGHAAAAQVGVEQAQRRRARPALGLRPILRRRGTVLHRHRHRSGRHAAPAHRRGRRRRRDGLPPRPWHRIQGIGRRVDAVVRGACAGGSVASSSARWCFDTPTTMPCFWSAAGRRSRSTRSGPVGSPSLREAPSALGDVDRRRRRAPRRRAPRRPGCACGCSRARRCGRSRRRRRCRGCRRRRRCPASAP